MEKPFFEVFPTLKMNEDLKNLFALTRVTKVALTRAKDFLRVHIFSEKLIQKKHIYQVEKAIREQLFAGVQMTVKIIEKFSLSRQYTPEKLLAVYKDSILEELKEYSIFEFNLFRKADCVFEGDDVLRLTLEESVISEGKGEELVRVLEKIFTERCGMSLKIHTEYKEPVESKARKNSDLKIQQEVEAILSRLPESSGGEAEPSAADVKAVQKQESKAKVEEKKENFRGKDGGNRDFKGKGRFGGDFGRPVRRSENPDVVYGRDVEEEAIPIEQIQEEMGEVVIRGQLLSVETRDIRNEKTIIIMEITDFTDTIGVKMFAKTAQAPEIMEGIKKDSFYHGINTCWFITPSYCPFSCNQAKISLVLIGDSLFHTNELFITN